MSREIINIVCYSILAGVIGFIAARLWAPLNETWTTRRKAREREQRRAFHKRYEADKQAILSYWDYLEKQGKSKEEIQEFLFVEMDQEDINQWYRENVLSLQRE